MRIINLFLILTFTLMFLFFKQNPEIDSTEMNKRMEDLYNNTFEIVEKMEYTNFYNEKLTAKKFAYNIINPLMYTIVAEINNLIPLTIHLANSGISKEIMIIIIIVTTIWLIITIPNIIKNIIAIYFFIKEKKKYKEKWYE